MEKKEKYISPESEALNVNLQGVLCASAEYNGFGSETDWNS